MSDIVEQIKSRSQSISPADMDQIFTVYTPLVKYIAYRLAQKLPSHIEIDDLISNGVIGLIDAIEKYDTSKETKFKTYAEIRIRGAMLDSLRSMDWVPRSIRQKSVKITNIYEELEQKLGRHPEDEEVARHLNIGIGEFYELLNNSKGMPILSLDEVRWTSSNGENKTLLETLSNPKNNDPHIIARVEEIKKLIAKSIDNLPEKERLVISLYYYEELTMKEIGEVLGITESRVSQLHTKSVLKLRNKLKQVM